MQNDPAPELNQDIQTFCFVPFYALCSYFNPGYFNYHYFVNKGFGNRRNRKHDDVLSFLATSEV